MDHILNVVESLMLFKVSPDCTVFDVIFYGSAICIGLFFLPIIVKLFEKVK